MIDIQLFKDILGFDSTSGSELLVSQFLEKRIASCAPVPPVVQSWDLANGSRNLLFSWGRPAVVFCTHMDTVPPYIAPRIEGDRIWGRGSCDAKGQIMAMFTACCKLLKEGRDGFGLLLVSGEETGSWGAKAFAKVPFQAPYLIVGEPTENKMVSASKGTKSFKISFTGQAFHSGYPQFGHSAIDSFVDFVNELRAVDFGSDPELGPTTWNIGRLVSDNPQNVLSPELRCRIYFRTTFASDALVETLMSGHENGVFGVQAVEIHARGGDTPAKYFTLPGIDSAPVAFGSDAPHLGGFEHKAICGPGTIRVAHRDDEFITEADIDTAVSQYIQMYRKIQDIINQ